MSSSNNINFNKNKKKCLNCMKDFDKSFQICPHCGYVLGTPPKELFYLTPGVIISNRYTIGTAIGCGGFGIIYKAWDMTLGRIVAIKEYYPRGLLNRIPGECKVVVYSGKRREEFKKGLAEFISESRTVSRFNSHPNILNVYDFFEENDTGYMVMEYLDGISLKDFIKNNGGYLNCDISVDIILSVLDALKEIHLCDYIHRDISPDNIFICNNGKIKLIDFGAARFSDGSSERVFSTILKVGYAPPEQYREKSNQGPWTDFYALGATLYRCVTGSLPPESTDRLVNKNNDPLIPPVTINPNIPEYLNNTILRALALEQSLRFQNTQQFKDALLQKVSVKTVENEVKNRKKKRLIAVAAALLSIACIYTFCFSSFFKKSNNNILDDTSITVWVKIDDNETITQAKSRFKMMSYDFVEAYDNINLVVEYYNEDEYDSKLTRAFKSGENIPTLFESENLDEIYYDKLSDMSSVVNYLNSNFKDEYYFMDQYSSYFPNKKQLPLGIDIPVVYVYTANNENFDVPGEISSLDIVKSGSSKGDYAFYYSEIVNYLSCYKNIKIQSTYNITYDNAEMYSDAFLVGSTNEFENGSIRYLFANLSVYSGIESSTRGKLEVIPQSGNNLYGYFTDMYSINDGASESEKKAARVLLESLIGEQSQSNMNYGNLSDNTENYGFHTLPVNKNALSETLSLYDISDIADEINNITMIGSDVSKTKQECMRIYENVKEE